MMLTAVCYQNLMICLFHCILRVHPMSMSSTCVLNYIKPSLKWCLSCIFVIHVVPSTSMQSSLHDVADFCDLVISAVCSCIIVMPCKPAVTMSSMHNLKILNKGVLLYLLCYIHPCPWLHLYPAVSCCNLLSNC